MKLFRRFLPFRTTVEWPSSDAMVAEGARKEVYQQLVNMGWDPDEEVFYDEEDFDLSVVFSDWSKEDSFAIIAGVLSPDEDFVFDFEFGFPKFAQVEHSSLDTELILRLHEEHTFPPIFPITAEGLMVGF